MKFGIREGMLKATWETVHQQAGEIGFDGVELEVGPKVPDEGSPLFDAAERKRLIERMEKHGVETSCVCIGAFWKYSPAEANESLRKTGLQLLRDTIEACSEIGAECILAPLNNSNEPPEVAVPRWVEFLQEAKADAESYNVIVALEPCTRPGLGTDKDVIRLIETVDSPFIQAYLDVANIRVAGVDSVQAVRSLGSTHLAHIHIKDLKQNPPGSERPFTVVGLGEGMLDFKGICKAILDVGYDGYLTLETPIVGDPKESAKKNLQFLKAFF